jgi:hypothetical protein
MLLLIPEANNIPKGNVVACDLAELTFSSWSDSSDHFTSWHWPYPTFIRMKFEQAYIDRQVPVWADAYADYARWKLLLKDGKLAGT